MTVGQIVGEALYDHKVAGRQEIRKKILQTLELCGLPSYYSNRYPHEFSGGQRQRIGIARSLALDPSFIICDEPVSALDVSIQSQIINLLSDLQKERNLSYMFISHDLSVVEYISDRRARRLLRYGVVGGPGGLWRVPDRRFRRMGQEGRGKGVRDQLRGGAGGLAGDALAGVHVRGNMRRVPGDRARRKCLLM